MSGARLFVCARCDKPLIGPRVVGAAWVRFVGWVCAFDVTPEEHRAYLDALIRNGGSW